MVQQVKRCSLSWSHGGFDRGLGPGVWDFLSSGAAWEALQAWHFWTKEFNMQIGQTGLPSFTDTTLER